jgi:uncharacterized membrane protein
MSNKIDWKRKLSSRKFWAAVIGFVTPVMTAFGATDIQVNQTISIITGCSVLIAYILAEGYTDSKHIEVAKEE